VNADGRQAGEFDLAEARVLVVDDSRTGRSILERFMRWAGVGQVELAGDGAEGLAKLEHFGPDLLLLDVAMPVLDGREMCRRLRADPRFADLPVIFQTALVSDHDRVACFEAGGSDIILKPLNYGETISRVRLHLEKQHMLRELKSFRRRIEQDLVAARSMQLSLIPQPAEMEKVAARTGLSIEAFFEPSSELGGDFWSLMDLPGGRAGVLVADFSGHGIPAAINTFRMHTVLEQLRHEDLAPADWLAFMGARLKDLLPPGQFATAFFGVVDVAAGTLTYAGAGHPPPVLVTPAGPVLLDASGVFLGVLGDPTYEQRTVSLPTGWGLLAYSDALVESPDRHGGMPGEDGVARFAAAAAAARPGERLPHVLEAFFAAGRRPLDDDLTAVWIEPRPAETGS